MRNQTTERKGLKFPSKSPSCFESNVGFHGNDIAGVRAQFYANLHEFLSTFSLSRLTKYASNVDTAERCQELCQRSSKCKYWTFIKWVKNPPQGGHKMDIYILQDSFLPFFKDYRLGKLLLENIRCWKGCGRGKD